MIAIEKEHLMKEKKLYFVLNYCENPIKRLRRLDLDTTKFVVFFCGQETIEYLPEIQDWILHHKPAFKVLFGYTIRIQPIYLELQVLAKNRQGLSEIIKFDYQVRTTNSIQFMDILNASPNLAIGAETIEMKQFLQRNGDHETHYTNQINHFMFYEPPYQDLEIIYNQSLGCSLLQGKTRSFEQQVDALQAFLPFKMTDILHNPLNVLKQKCDAAFLNKFESQNKGVIHHLKHRLKGELDVIEEKQWANEFLLAADLVDGLRNQRIYVSVQGAFSSSLISYLLDISRINPLSRIDETFLPGARWGWLDHLDGHFDLAFTDPKPILELYFPMNFLDKEDFLMAVLDKYYLQFLGLPISKKRYAESSQYFVIYPRDQNLPEKIDYDVKPISIYTKEDLWAYYPIVALYDQWAINMLSPAFHPSHYLELLREDSEIIKDIKREVLTKIAATYEKDLAEFVDLAQCIAYYLSYYKRSIVGRLEDIILCKESLFYRLTQQGVDLETAIYLVRNYEKDETCQQELGRLVPEFNPRIKLFSKGHILEMTILMDHFLIL